MAMIEAKNKKKLLSQQCKSKITNRKPDKTQPSDKTAIIENIVIPAVISAFVCERVIASKLDEKGRSKMQADTEDSVRLLLTSLGVTTPLQAMIATQMVSIHNIQQKLAMRVESIMTPAI
jgi:hypothetical protein